MERKERFYMAFEHLRMTGVIRTQKSLADALGASAPHISSALKGDEKYLTDNLLMRFCTKFPMFRLKWLLNGEGEMLVGQESESLNDMEEERKGSYFSQERIAESISSSREPIINNTGVPYFNFDFQMGFDPKVLDNRTNPDAYFDIAPYNNCTLWCNARGNSMYPTISSGDMVALKRIEDFSYLISGEIYAIITKNELRTIKRVKDRGDKLLLVPDNKEYEEQEIPKEVVMHIFLVKGVLKSF